VRRIRSSRSGSKQWFVLALLVGISCAVPASADDVQSQLDSDYKGKILTLRHSYRGEHLRFSSDGTLNGDSSVGSWTTDGQITVTGIKMHGNTLTISGKRLVLFYDPDRKGLRDAVPVDKKDNAFRFFGNGHSIQIDAKLAPLNRKVEIDLPTNSPASSDISKAMNTVFLAPGESLANAAPNYWHDYLDHSEHPNDSEAANRSRKQGAFTPPRLLQHFDPSFSDAARKVGYQGTALMNLVVDASGAISDIQMRQPLGMGLDDEAVFTVRKWTFEPARRDGVPETAKLVVEVEFRLY
jgi:TonB family protein